MRYATTPCLNAGCYNIASNKGRCDEHQVEYKTVSRKDRLPPDWNTRRKIVLTRDNYTCYLCGSNSPIADTVDHVIAGDDHSLDNLKPVHDINPPHCHREKTLKDIQRINEENKIKYKKF